MQQIRFMARPGARLGERVDRSAWIGAVSEPDPDTGDAVTATVAIRRGDRELVDPGETMQGGDILQVVIRTTPEVPLMAAALWVGAVSTDTKDRLQAMEAALYRGIACVVAGGPVAAVRHALNHVAKDVGGEWTPRPIIRRSICSLDGGASVDARRRLVTGQRLMVGLRLDRPGTAVPRSKGASEAGLAGIGCLQTVMATPAGPVILTRIAED
ncbi:MAG: hypothetical protein JXQ27_00225 [Acidobacteria bacterium]|nr:hypothetical protein [Acidobacteriota bacterium]